MMTFAAIAVSRIIDDLRDRSGLGNEWEQIDDDIQDEIVLKWRNIIEAEYSEDLLLKGTFK